MRSSVTSWRFGALSVVLVTIAMQVASAVVLKSLADQSQLPGGLSLLSWATLAGIAGALAINLVRLYVWGYAHRNFPLSATYPLTSLYFPIMLGVSLAYGEPHHLRDFAGAGLITAGAFWIASGRSEDEGVRE